MNSIKDQKNLNKKKVLLRLDLNVPLKNGSITDETRINKIIPIIDFLIKEQSKIIIISHIGRPKGRVITDLSLKPICENLEKKLMKKIQLFDDNIFKLKKKDLSIEKINSVFEDFSKKNKVIEITKEKLVSIDFNHNSASSIIDANLTNVVGKNMGKISAWYDNEWGFSNRMCDIAEYIHKIS